MNTASPSRPRPPRASPVKRMSLACPHCGSRLISRTSRLITDTCREVQLQCENALCSASYTGQLIIVGQISPSAVPNPAVHLRTVPARRPAFERTDPGTDPPPPANDPPPLIRRA